MLNYSVIRTVSSKRVASGSGTAALWTVNVNTAATSAVLKIYDGTSTAGTLVAQIDASVTGSYAYGVRCENGIFADLSGGIADCTIGYA